VRLFRIWQHVESAAAERHARRIAGRTKGDLSCGGPRDYYTEDEDHPHSRPAYASPQGQILLLFIAQQLMATIALQNTFRQLKIVSLFLPREPA